MAEKIILITSREELQELIREAVRIELQAQNKAPPKEEKEYMTLKDTAKYLGISTVSCRLYTKQKLLTAYKLSNQQIRYVKSEIDLALIKTAKYSRKNIEY